MYSPKKNFFYNIIYQVLILVIPLITAPYISRVIGVDGIGTYSYTYSIVYYFMLITMLGVNNYGNRTIAKVRNDKEQLSNTFWNIFIIQFVIGIFMIFFYFLGIIYFNPNYKNIAMIEALFIISSMFDINWFFFGIEEFKTTIVRNSVIKITTLILIVLFVRENSDLWKYAFIMSSMSVMSQMVLWPFLRKKINRKNISIKMVKKHFKSDVLLFIPVIAVSLYKMMDKIMLGLISGISEVGFYENAEKIINIPIVFITALGTVMLPRISNLMVSNDLNKIREYINKSIKLISFISFAMCMGLIAIGFNFAPIFFGIQFEKTGILIALLALSLPFISFANVIRTQYLIPKENDKIYIKSVFMGAAMNLVMNYIFIPKYGSIGASLGTIVAEITVMVYQTFAIHKELPIKKYLFESSIFAWKSLIMLSIIYPINYIKIDGIIKIIFQVILGCIIYGIINIKYILSIINLSAIIRKFKDKKIFE